MAIEFIRILGPDGEPISYPLREIGDQTERITTCIGDALLSGLVVVRHQLAEGYHDLTPHLPSESPGWCTATVTKAGTAVLLLGLKGVEDHRITSRHERFEHRRTGDEVVSRGASVMHVPESSAMAVLYGVGSPEQGLPDQGYGVVRHVERTKRHAPMFDQLPIQELPPVQ